MTIIGSIIFLLFLLYLFCKCKHVKIWTKLNSSSCKSLKHFQFSFPAIIIWQRWDLVFKKHSFSHKKKRRRWIGWLSFETPKTKRKLSVAFCFVPFILQFSFQIVLKYSPLTFFTGTMNEALVFNLGGGGSICYSFHLFCGSITLINVVGFF